MRRLFCFASARSTLVLGNNSGSSNSGGSSSVVAMRFETQKLARVLSMEINKMKSQYRMNPTQENREKAVDALSTTPFASVQGLDGKVISQMLQALAEMEVPGTHPFVERCVSWTVENIATIGPHSIAHLCTAMEQLQYPRRFDILDSIAGQVMNMIGDMHVGGVAVILSTFAPFYSSSKLVAKAVQRCRDTLADGGTEEMVQIAVGALYAAPSPDRTVLLEETMARIVDAVESLTVTQAVDAIAPALATDHALECIPPLFSVVERNSAKLDVSHISKLVRCLEKLSTKKMSPYADKIVLLLDQKAMLQGISPQDVVQLLAPFRTMNVATAVPPVVVSTVANALENGEAVWTPQSVRLLLSSSGSVPSLKEKIDEFILKKVEALTSSDGLMAAALLTQQLFELHTKKHTEIVKLGIDTWSQVDVAVWLRAASFVQTPEMRELMRQIAPKLVEKVATLQPAVLASFAAAYGKAKVRHDNLCNAIADRAMGLAHSLSLFEIATILGALAAVDYRQTRPFLDLAPRICMLMPSGSPLQVTNLIVSFAKLSVWNYRLFARAAERAWQLRDKLTISQIVVIVTALNRMELRFDKVLHGFLEQVRSAAQTCSLHEAIQILSAFSRTRCWDLKLFDILGSRLAEAQNSLDANAIGEILQSFSRVGLKHHAIFQDITLRALAVAPTCPPLAMANIISAYAGASCRHDELFTVLGDRVLSLKDECPAVTIAAVLVSFATAGIKNDKLFIEMIPRVRHVTQYGGPQDVANVLTAYTTVGIWHYKLFVRLAERAIQVRGDCQPAHIAQILNAYAKVEMKYEKIFVELSSRIQTLAQEMGPTEVVTILNAYATIRVFDSAVFAALGDTAAKHVEQYEEEEGKKLVAAFRIANLPHKAVASAFAKYYPTTTTNTSSSAATTTSNGASNGEQQQQHDDDDEDD